MAAKCGILTNRVIDGKSLEVNCMLELLPAEPCNTIMEQILKALSWSILCF